MTSVATRWRSWPLRWRSLTPPVRLLLAVTVSLILHLVLLLLQFGQYGVGLPGLGWPDFERHARDQPALAIRVQQPAQITPDPPGGEVALPPPVSAPALSTSAPVDSFVMVPRYQAPIVTKAAITLPAAGEKTSSAPSRIAVLSSTKQNLDFKVAQASASDPELASTDVQSQSGPPESVADRDPASAVAAQDLEETQALARRSADQEQSLKDRQSQQLAAIADETKKMSEVLQQESAAREASQREQLAQQMQDAEQAREQAQQRSREQLLREQDLEQKRTKQQALERLGNQRLERQQQERRLAGQQLAQQQQLEQQRAEQQRIEQQRIEQQRIEQQRIEQKRIEPQRIEQQRTEQQRIERQRIERQHNEQLQAERDAAAARQYAAQATQSSVQGASGVDELTGEPLAAPARVRLDTDKIFAGRSADFDQAGSALKTPSNSLVATGQRRSIFGSKTADVELNLYKQGWRQKIERNGRLNYSQSAKDRMHTDPIVTVSIRSDGSLDGVVILRSSGRPEMDDAVRRIAAINAPYSAFPPGLARKFDIIDIRQIWIFDDLLKIADEM